VPADARRQPRFQNQFLKERARIEMFRGRQFLERARKFSSLSGRSAHGRAILAALRAGDTTFFRCSHNFFNSCPFRRAG
jgi:hypothetical protein